MESSRNGADLFKQNNKAHKGVSQKIAKRRQQDKKRKQEKKVKESKGVKGRDKRKSRMEKYIGKIVRSCKGDCSEIEELFDAMDQGAEISINSLESEIMMKLLKKIFRLLELKKNSNKEYYKPEGHESLKLKFQHLVRRYKNKNSTEAPQSESNSNQESNDDRDDSEHGAKSNPGSNIEDELEVIEAQGDDDNSEVGRSNSKNQLEANRGNEEKKYDSDNKESCHNKIVSEVGDKQKVKVYGPARPAAYDSSPSEQVRSLYETDREKSNAELLSSGLFDNLLGGKGYESDHRSKLRHGLVGPKANERAKEPEKESDQQQKLKQYFEDYDKLYRPKSLLEIHQEKKKTGKAFQPPEQEHFDPSKMGYRKVDSKNVFQIINQANKSLTSKFIDGKFKNTFV